ncbi:hypothetical protein SERLA73DRAFT_187253 [Serpula lacrymans var. lacrymans S7.3]|uniref:Metallo-beta-lactamase domain-containing protein n=2 Tax=Serpula lacrymans var. lacrymans TaxID=341189 RepID=F8Q8R6_SERL3|nr:uncharacterized protein SERLADRAFT_476688 [Serpula lacrymans var. lacrymans S7.9]EGN94971.1 hypothetical protein SERLA73DRAFT_187253 [Serpula lacrymans var. lacrymans S7.3]EGO20462.1 hypothetical protein SERLADRAFT_476688 [Serpula lacrymans var. lacrymans S7.9]
MSAMGEGILVPETFLPLPGDTVNQPYVSVSCIPAGFLHLPDREVFDDALEQPESTGRQVPSFAFLIDHSEYGKLLFDLGLRKHGQGYPPTLRETLEIFVVHCPRDVVDLLQEGGVSPSEIRAVIYSHLHFDHVGDLTPFISAQLILGSEAAQVMKKTYPKNPDSVFAELPPGQKVRYVSFAEEEEPPTVDQGSYMAAVYQAQINPAFPIPSREMPSSTVISPLGSFTQALDLFNDGSFYLLDAPGHFPGHLAALARVAPNRFVLLAADCCHNRICYDPGDRLVSRENYHNVDDARDTVLRLKRMNQEDNVVVILAHETERLHEMPLFPRTLNQWADEEASRKALRNIADRQLSV